MGGCGISGWVETHSVPQPAGALRHHEQNAALGSMAGMIYESKLHAPLRWQCGCGWSGFISHCHQLVLLRSFAESFPILFWFETTPYLFCSVLHFGSGSAFTVSSVCPSPDLLWNKWSESLQKDGGQRSQCKALKFPVMYVAAYLFILTGVWLESWWSEMLICYTGGWAAAFQHRSIAATAEGGRRPASACGGFVLQDSVPLLWEMLVSFFPMA